MDELNRKRTGMLLKCCMCIGGAMGMVSNCMGIYFSSLSEALGVGVGRISVIVTLVSLANAFFAPVFVKLQKHFRLNHLMGFGIVLCMISYVLMSFAGNVWTLYFCGLLSGVGMCFYAALPVTQVLRDCRCSAGIQRCIRSNNESGAQSYHCWDVLSDGAAADGGVPGNCGTAVRADDPYEG